VKTAAKTTATAKSAGPRSSHPTHSAKNAEWMGHPSVVVEGDENKQRQQQIPPLRCGMTNKKTSNGNNNSNSSNSNKNKQRQ